MANIKDLKGKVLSILQTVPRTRNCDISLTLNIWAKYYGHLLNTNSLGKLCVQLEVIKLLPREDNVKRIRAKIQNEECVYLPTDPEVRKARRIEEDQWLSWARNEHNFT